MFTSTIQIILLLVLGCFSGLVISFFYTYVLRKKYNEQSNNFIKEAIEQQKNLLNQNFEAIKTSIKESSYESLRKSTESLTQIAESQLHLNRDSITKELNSNKELVAQNINNVGQALGKLNTLIFENEKSHHQKHGEICTLIDKTQKQGSQLAEATSSLNQILSNSQVRGHWGERVAQDILNMIGFVENIHYKKQFTLKSGQRPDYSFILPDNVYLHMDVKFPIENYKRYITENTLEGKQKYKKLFASDIRQILKSLSLKEYIDPNSTTSCMLLFIPHEHVFSFIQEVDPELFTNSLKNQILLCSPMTLFPILAVIRKSIENFTIQKTSQEILTYINNFKKQWAMYNKSFDTLGKRISELELEYQRLVSTRARQLNNAFEKINTLSQDPNTQKDLQL
jgi:DNA recombination protein RmuC